MTEGPPRQNLSQTVYALVIQEEPLTAAHYEALEKIHGNVTLLHYSAANFLSMVSAVVGFETLFQKLYIYTDSAFACMACILVTKRSRAGFGFLESDLEGHWRAYHWDGFQFAIKWDSQERQSTTVQAGL